MRMRWLWVMVAALVLAGPARGLAEKDPSRDVFLQTIGLLAGQGLVLGHISLEGIAVRFDKKLLAKDKALELLAGARRYADLVLETFSGRLMAQLSGEEKQDLTLLAGFYEAQRDAMAALAQYVRGGGQAARQDFEEHQARVAAIIRQISLTGAKPQPAAREARP